MLDLILWNRFVQGDNEAFEVIYTLNFDFLYNYTHRLTGSSDLTKEFLSDDLIIIQGDDGIGDETMNYHNRLKSVLK